MIDWDLFSARVKTGTPIRYVERIRKRRGDKDEAMGLLLDTTPYAFYDRPSPLHCDMDEPDMLRYEVFRRYVECSDSADAFDYFIDGRWQTFTELMQP